MEALEGKTILVVGGGNFGKRDTFEAARSLGLMTVLLDFEENPASKDLVNYFIASSYQNEPAHFDSIVQEVATKLKLLGVEIDGALTFWETATPLTARIQEHFGLTGNSFESAMTAKNKLKTFQTLSQNVTTANYVSPFLELRTVGDIEKIPDSWYPIVVKFCPGASSYGIETATTRREAKTKYVEICKELPSKRFVVEGMQFGLIIKAVPKLIGTEHDADVAISNGELLAAVVSDYGPTMADSCNETSYVYPTRLPENAQKSMIEAAVACCKGVGLANGVFNVQLFWTPEGPKLVEINQRPPACSCRHIIRDVWGFDVYEAHFAISVGIKPKIDIRMPDHVVHAILCYSLLHGKKLTLDALKTLAGRDHITVAILGLPRIDPPLSQYEFPYAQVAVSGRNEHEARARMRAILQEFDVEFPVYDFVA